MLNNTPDLPEPAAAPEPPGPHGADGAPPLPETDPPAAAAAPPAEPGRNSGRANAARRANALKSTGPRTERGKRIVSQNARRSVRLLGLAEARTLNQDLDAAERLYREMIAPFEPAPALLARHFQDLARLYLELEAWERIRDFLLEHRWEQVSLERRRRYREMQRDLRGTLSDVFKDGLYLMEDSPAKFRQMLECLTLLREQLARRDFDLQPVLANLYGNALDPVYSRAQTICMRCERLMDPQKKNPLTPDEFEGLRDLVELEYRDALEAHNLALDEKTMTRAACLSTLGATSVEDVRMIRQGERLRQAIDRKQRTITSLLRVFGYLRGGRTKSVEGDENDGSPLLNFGKTKLISPAVSTKRSKNKAETKLKTAARPRAGSKRPPVANKKRK